MDDDSRETNQVNIEITGGISDISGKVNIAGGHIFQFGDNATFIIGQTAHAVRGLTALRELMQHSTDVQSAVIAFRTDLKVVHEQIDQIADYKDLHDLLHHLQIECYNNINQAKSRFPGDQPTIDDLINYSLTLEETLEKLTRVANKPTISKHELGWISDVGSARADLMAAIDTNDKILLMSVVRRLKRVLDIQPARINHLLNYSVRAFRLPALLSALAIVRQTLISLDLDSDKVIAFQSGVDALSKLEKELNLFVEDHDNWQDLDVELRLIEISIENDLSEFEMSWSDIKIKFEHLYTNNTEEWANTLRNDVLALDEALETSNVAKVRRNFYNYHRRANFRFFQIDTQLKVLCDELRKIGVPITSVLDDIQ